MGMTYGRNDHQDIVDVKPADLNLRKDAEDHDQRGDDHCCPDAPFEFWAFVGGLGHLEKYRS